MMLAVAAFIITANLPTLNPWLSLYWGFLPDHAGDRAAGDRTQAEP